MSKRTKRMVSILLTLSLLVALLVPMAAPAGAKSINGISRVISVADNYSVSFQDADTFLTVKEDADFSNDFRDGNVFRLILKSGAKWADDVASWLDGNIKSYTDGVASPFEVSAARISNTTLELTLVHPQPGQDSFEIPLGFDANGITGDITVQIDSIDSGLTGNTYTFATVRTGYTTAVSESVETISKSGDTAGVIRIDEVAVGAIPGGTSQKIKIKLPSNFVWMTGTAAVGAGAFVGATVTIDASTIGEQTLVIDVAIPAGPRDIRGSIYVTPIIRANSGASFGEIEVAVTGSPNIDDSDVVIAEYVDWTVDFKVKSVKELTAGKSEDVTTDTITIEEKVAGTLINGRDLTFTLPDWVKVTNIRSWSTPTNELSPTGKPSVATAVGASADIDGKSNEFDIYVQTSGTTNAGKLEFKLDLTIETNKSGEIEATIKGAGVPETTLVIANANPSVSAAVDEINEVKIGVQSQDIADFYITEEIKAAARTNLFGTAKAQGYINITAPDGVKFAATPTAEVTEGNLTLKGGAKLANNASNISETVFQIPIDSESTRPSTIKISNIKVTVDRTYPEGDIRFRVGGPALTENKDTLAWKYLNSTWLPEPSTTGSLVSAFTTDTVVAVKVANCVTPAPGEVVTTDTVFTIGSTTYTVNGVEQTMDIAPYIKDDRTFIPLRFVARATGVSDENILFNQEYQTVTLIKGDRVVVTTIGSNILQVNGAAITMDTAPELVDPPGRTMFPIRWVATALGCNVDWDPDTQEVRIY